MNQEQYKKELENWDKVCKEPLYQFLKFDVTGRIILRLFGDGIISLGKAAQSIVEKFCLGIDPVLPLMDDNPELTVAVRIAPSERVEPNRTVEVEMATVWIVRGVQSFRLDYTASKEECEWYARMLRKALRIDEKDACQVCHGERGGEPGNENIVNGVVMCDYCHAELIRKGTEG